MKPDKRGNCRKLEIADVVRHEGMGGSRIFDWGGPRIVKVRDDGQNVALIALKSWRIGGGHGPVAPPLEPPMLTVLLFRICTM